MSFLMRWWVPYLWTRTTWQEYCSYRFQEEDRKLLQDFRDFFCFKILWLQNVIFRKPLTLEKDVQMVVTSMSGLWLRKYNSDWSVQAALELEVLSGCSLCLRATDDDFGAKYSLESTIVYPVALSQCSRLPFYLGV